jgi:hypothetical protein
MTALIISGIIVASIISAILRRVHGGWLGLRGALARALLIIWTAIPMVWWSIATKSVWWIGPQISNLVVTKFAVSIILIAMVWLHWVMGVKFARLFDHWEAPVYRYSYFMIGALLITGHWAFLAVGPLAALAYYLSQKYGGGVDTPLDGPRGVFIDGGTSWAELCLGLVSGAACWSLILRVL